MSDTTQTQFARPEGTPAFPDVADTGNDNPADSSSDEETTTDPTQTPDGDENTGEEEKQDNGETKNLNDHPRWKQREEDWKNRFNDQEKRHTDEIQKLRQDMESHYNKSSNDDSDVPQWFGGDENQWQDFVKWNDEQVGRVKSDALSEINSKNQEEQNAIEEATEYMNSEIDTIQSDKTLNPDGVQVDRNKLLKFVLDNELVDTQGRWNYKAGWRLMQAGVKSAKDKTLNAKKEVASATTKKGKVTTDKPSYMTSEDFSNPNNRPW